jgi:hypothetical protein
MPGALRCTHGSEAISSPDRKSAFETKRERVIALSPYRTLITALNAGFGTALRSNSKG